MGAETQDLKIHYVPISEISPAAYNPRKLTQKEYDDLKASLSQFGFVDPVIVNQNTERKGTLVGGHQRLKVWRDMGNDTVPAVFVDLDMARERELNIRLNRNNGSWSWDILEENFEPAELTAWGFTDKDLFGHFKNKTEGDDDAPSLPATAKTKIGDIYQLGQHRILCGDSTKIQDVQKLMGGGRADMVFTDPPYNVNYKGTGKETSRTIENDNMDQAAFRSFLEAAFANYASVSVSKAALYCCYATKTHREFEDSLNKAGFEVANQIVWVKNNCGMGWGHYRWKHEPILYCRRPGADTAFYGDRRQYTTWDSEKTDEELLAMFKAMITKEEAGGSTVWRYSRDTGYKHPTQKPVELVTRAIENSSKRGAVVLDLFMGSGTTLIAAEKTDRIAYGMEMAPEFVDVIVQRYVDFCIKNDREWSVLLNNQDISSDFGPKESEEDQNGR